MSYARDVGDVFRGSGFRRLLSVRIAGQLADGVFQTALASYVLFSPERQTDPSSIAFAFAVLLLPYSLLGPFMGVLIDRWRRRQILIAANLLRAGVVLITAYVAVSPAPEGALLTCGVVAISINRLVLSALGASIPRVVTLDRVVMANAIAPTLGTLATLAGAGLGVALRAAAGGAGDTSDAIVMAAAAGAYLAAGLLSLRMGPNQLGPAVAERITNTWGALAHVVHGLTDGLREIGRTVRARDALIVSAVQRFCFGTATVTLVLLERNTFNATDDPDAGVRGLAVAVAASGMGIFLGAVVTPLGTRKLGSRRWIPLVLAVGAVSELVMSIGFNEKAIVGTAFVLGFVAQAVKVTVDSILQRSFDDAYRGRVFSLYDVIYNVAFVGSAAIAAIFLPTSGESYFFVIGISALYAVTAFIYLQRGKNAPAFNPIFESSGEEEPSPS